jgi:hypothetical protein
MQNCSQDHRRKELIKPVKRTDGALKKPKSLAIITKSIETEKKIKLLQKSITLMKIEHLKYL